MKILFRPHYVFSMLMAYLFFIHFASFAMDNHQVSANQTIFREMSRFSHKMMRALVEEEAANRCISGASVHHALGMAFLGSGEKSPTEQAMAKTLGLLEFSREKIASDYGNMVAKLTFKHEETATPTNNMREPPFEVIVANRVVAFHGARVQNNFFHLMTKMGASVSQFNDDVTSPIILLSVNDWVADKTHNRIPGILQKIEDDDRVVLLNATYFQGSWQHPFDKYGTQSHSFTLASGEETNVQMMRSTSHYRFMSDVEDQMIELPYATAKTANSDLRFAMYIVLPAKGKNITNAVANFDIDRLEKLEKSGWTNVEVRLPKFKIEADMDVIKTLKSKSMGMEEALSQGADFSNMVTSAVAISQVRHKALVEVDEKGTVAAAATAVVMCRMGSIKLPPPPALFTVDRPFMFFIKDKELNVVLFEGVVMNPNLQ